MQLKTSVTFHGITPEMLLGIIIVNSIFQKNNYELVITSITDSKHSLTSLHYVGNAIAIRISNIPPANIGFLINELKNSLGSNFDVVHEIDHIHIEYQPKFRNS
jgi:hypothetical protein